MTKTEAERRAHLAATLRDLGFTDTEADALRRISNTLRRWHEMECGTGEGQILRTIERDETERPFLRVQYPSQTGYVDRRYPVADRETGARKRLDAILKARNERRTDALDAYIQTDPRGAALYILRPGDIPADSNPESCYTRGICVY